MFVSARVLLPALLVSVFLGLAAAATAAEPEWTTVADVDTVHVLTTNADGGARATKIWIVVIDDTPYIRTSRRTRWGENVARDPEIALRIEGVEVPLRAHFIEGADERARIVGVFDEKYGSNPLLNWIRGDDPPIMRLDPR